MGIVYSVFCVKSGKYYIGQTIKSLKHRWNTHKNMTSCCVKLRNAIKKHGVDSFELSILFQTNVRFELNEAEIYWINFFDSIQNGYNIKAGGSRGEHSIESRLKMSASHQNRSLETRKKMSDARKGKTLSKQAKQKLSNFRTGKKHSAETLQKISISQKARHARRILKHLDSLEIS